ncbi:MAG: VOC family protein [Bacteroidetes bacterium]|nr:VOC family protein [Bacteroidota bacterium]
MNPVVHFEMGAHDTARMQKFYQMAFGWQTQQLGEEMGSYVLVTTTETDEKGMVKTPGTINGGFYKKTDDVTSHAPSVVIAVTNLDEMMEKVKAAGGKILRDPDDIPGVGKWVSFQDTEGNRVSMLQPLM